MVVAGDGLWWVLFASWLFIVIWFDVTTRRIPNACVVIALAVQLGFLVTRISSAWPPPWPGAISWLDALEGFVLGCAFFLLWQRKWMGAGDVKLLAVLGFCIGLRPLMGVILGASVLAGLHVSVQLGIWAAREWRHPHTGGALRRTPYAAYLGIAALSLALMRWNSASCFWFSLSCSTGS